MMSRDRFELNQEVVVKRLSDANEYTSGGSAFDLVEAFQQQSVGTIISTDSIEPRWNVDFGGDRTYWLFTDELKPAPKAGKAADVGESPIPSKSRVEAENSRLARNGMSASTSIPSAPETPRTVTVAEAFARGLVGPFTYESATIEAILKLDDVYSLDLGDGESITNLLPDTELLYTPAAETPRAEVDLTARVAALEREVARLTALLGEREGDGR